ncbi:MAG: cyclase family protein [Dehalococcoidia bacterium]
MPSQPPPTKEEIQSWRTERRNWGRWGDDDSAGAVNLITAEKRLQAVGLVQSGRTVSLSRMFPKTPGPLNPTPAQHFMRTITRGETGGGVVDYYGLVYHGHASTHIDALCHVWDENGMWNGRDPNEEITADGAKFADIMAWKDGIITRGVLLDVPRYRGEPYVTLDKPVHGAELEEIAKTQDVEVGAGDALIVYSGREAYQAGHPQDFLGRPPSPGLHASCCKFIRDRDVAVLGWDLMDARPDEHGHPWPVHSVLYCFGVALMDNALLAPLADVCAEEGRYEFMLMLLPLPVEGGTGSPANPVAMF